MEANKKRRKRLACGETSETQHDTQHDDLSDDELQDEDFEETDLAEFMEASMTCSTPEVSDCPVTRNSSKLSSSTPLLSTVTIATQTEATELKMPTFHQFLYENLHAAVEKSQS